MKQQKLIKKLLRKRESSNDLLENVGGGTVKTSATTASTEDTEAGKTEDDAFNDSDSAIIIEDLEISLAVPNLPLATPSVNTNDEANVTKIARSVSDVVRDLRQSPPNSSSSIAASTSEAKQGTRKGKDERARINYSNRQKLLLLKRHHSGYLKRPEILETVYSVEEDGEQQQQQQLEQQPKEDAKRRESSVSLAGIFRKRLDSDLTTTTGSDCSTDDESTRIVLSETESCSLQSCSRSSICHCPQCTVSASAPASRRSSYGSSVASSGVPVPGSQDVAKAYYRVMSNHRTVTKPKDVKFKRINKAKSRSLEELRGRLKGPLTRSSSTNDEDIEDLEEDEDDKSRLAQLRTVIKQKSLSLEQESTD